MGNFFKREALEALGKESLPEVLEKLKRGVKEDPYWAEGHRLLGDIYFFKLDHPVYALIAYRKLEHVKQKLDNTDKIRLGWAYVKRGFFDKALKVLKPIEESDLPEKTKFLDEKFEPKKIFNQLQAEIRRELREQTDEYVQKHVSDGNDFSRIGNLSRACESYRQALELKDDPEIRVKLARTLVERARFPEAIEELKGILLEYSDYKPARKLLEQVYGRLGLFSENLDKTTDKNDEDFELKRLDGTNF